MLPTEQAAAVVLVDIEGFSVEEAAAILDVPTGTVKSRARGRADGSLGGCTSSIPVCRRAIGRNDHVGSHVQPKAKNEESL